MEDRFVTHMVFKGKVTGLDMKGPHGPYAFLAVEFFGSTLEVTIHLQKPVWGDAIPKGGDYVLVMDLRMGTQGCRAYKGRIMRKEDELFFRHARRWQMDFNKVVAYITGTQIQQPPLAC
jgi:hypothetical protein